MASNCTKQALIISASRRTDIPRYFAAWFGGRRREGVAQYRTAYGVKGRVSLARDDVLGYVFWTRDARPFECELHALQNEGIKFAMQFTINGYSRSLEPYRPSVAGALASFRAVSAMLPGPGAIQWRYDPIILCDDMPAAFHVRAFAQLARELEGATRVVNVSIIEPYAKTVRRLPDPTVRFRRSDPQRHRSLARRNTSLPIAEEAPSLLRDLAIIASERRIELRVCSNPEYSFPRSQCIGSDLFEPYGISLVGVPEAPSRSACRCLRSIDIGMDNTCVSGCRYCYVTSAHQLAVDNLRSHDPSRSSLRPISETVTPERAGQVSDKLEH